MMMFDNKPGKLIVSCLLPLALVACGSEEVISFSKDVKPVLDHNCLQCHQSGGTGHEASGFSMVSYEELMSGTHFGPMIIAGDAEGSNMVVLMEGRADPSISMPHGQQKAVSKLDIQIIRTWIDQGAKNN